ncbi:MAG TPA: hypothetical protein VLF89_02300, partial [Candidatus Saccharimonadales bacterium]|nr:hypothetical protein [Candidatus Saccharimonadales bacterium]
MITLLRSYWNGSAANNLGFSLQNKVTNNSPPGYQLSFQNNSGAEIASLNSTGDLALSGALTSTTGTNEDLTISPNGSGEIVLAKTTKLGSLPAAPALA